MWVIAAAAAQRTEEQRTGRVLQLPRLALISIPVPFPSALLEWIPVFSEILSCKAWAQQNSTCVSKLHSDLFWPISPHFLDQTGSSSEGFRIGPFTFSYSIFSNTVTDLILVALFFDPLIHLHREISLKLDLYKFDYILTLYKRTYLSV